MSVASTVSRLPITVKVVPVSANEKEEGEQRVDRNEDSSQQRQSEQHASEAGDAWLHDANTESICARKEPNI